MQNLKGLKSEKLICVNTIWYDVGKKNFTNDYK